MRFEKIIHLSAPLDVVWKILADTDRLNREIGLPPIHFEFKPRAGGGSDASATVKVAGMTLKYREHPFEWVRPEFYHVRRTFFDGPIKEIWGGVNLTNDGGRTAVHVYSEIEPNGFVGSAICHATGWKAIADFSAACKSIEAFFNSTAMNPYRRHAAKPSADFERLTGAKTRLRLAGANAPIVERLGDYLSSSPPEDTVSIRPFELADLWGVDRRVLLETCLLAARTGMLELRWRVLCPYCRGGPSGVARLNEVESSVHCETCNIKYDPEFDRSVELCFAVSPAIRPVHPTIFCIGGPGLSPHAAAQWILSPGDRRKARIGGMTGSYVLNSLQTGPSREVTLDQDIEQGFRAVIAPDGDSPKVVVEKYPEEGYAEWDILNQTDETIILRLEMAEWRTDSATAAYVTTLPAFRDQFGSEVLSPGALRPQRVHGYVSETR